MNIDEITAKLSQATQHMTAEEQQELMRIFRNISNSATEEKEHTNVFEELPPRVARLKDIFLKAMPTISIQRALAFTKVAKENPGMDPTLMRAKAFKYACETAPIVIGDEELIVGSPCGGPRHGAFSPDISWRWVEEELDTLGTRDQDPFYLSEDDKKILKEEVFPYWKGRSVDERCETLFKEAGVWEFSAESFVSDCSYHQLSGGGDANPGYDVILMHKGMQDIHDEALEYLKTLDYGNPEDMERIYFYKGVLETTEGVMIYARRIAEEAKRRLAVETNEGRKKELEQIIEVNSNVPARKPRTFWEALQSVWTIESLMIIEENQTGLSIGRVDQYLYPYYQHDVEQGIITKEEAFELFCCFIIKIAEMMWMTSKDSAKFFAGYQVFANMCVGGVKRDGTDATNELTYLIMDAVKATKVYQPSFSCRIHRNSPEKFLRKIVEVMKAGNGFPACHFDELHIQMMLAKGVSVEDARDYCMMGCVEPQKAGRLYQWTTTSYAQWPLCIEMVLNRGIPLHYGKRIVPDQGSLENFRTYEAFEKAVKDTIAYVTKWTGVATVIVQKAHRDLAPKPLMSIMHEGCMEKGKDVSAGGAMYNYGPGVVWTGLATYADSMLAIKTLVFDQKKYTLTQLNEALKANFVGYDEIRRDCLEVPKYGNDNDLPDKIAADLIDFTEKEHNKQKTLYSKMSHGTLSTSNNTPLGMVTGATADGRLAGAPLSDGISPTQGMDKNGPTAVIKSVSKMRCENMNIGMVHNFKVLKGLLDTPEGEQGIVSLLKAGVSLGIGQMQFNYTDDKILLDAQKHPEKYRDLIVRVAGYSAYFIELCKEVQDEVISRTTISNF